MLSVNEMKGTNINMKCPVCNNEAQYIEDFKPYMDMPWSFPLYNCFQCKTRFAVRDSNINYHEILYDKGQESSYGFYFDIGQCVKNLLAAGEIEACEKYLRQRRKYSNLIDFVYKNATNKSSILEIGCSTGFITAFLRAKGYSAFGIDISHTAVETAIHLFGNYYSEIKDFKGEKVDIVIHCGMIGCVDNPKCFLDTYLELLNSGGKMYFNAPSLERVIQTKEKWCSTLPPDLIYLYSVTSYKFLLDKNLYSFQISVEYENNTTSLYLRKFLSGHFISYSGNFINSVESDRKRKTLAVVKKSIHWCVHFIDKILISSSLIKKLPQEYGMYITVIKL